MKRGGGKRKGNAFENKTCRALSLWVTRGEDHTQFIPCRLSGGWKDAGRRHAGDIAANGEHGENFRTTCVVECKHYKGDLLWGMLTKHPDYSIVGFWAKLSVEARNLDLVPLLVFRQNGRPVLVGMPPRLATWVCEYPRRRGWTTNIPRLKFQNDDYEFDMVAMDALVTIDPEDFLAQSRNVLKGT